MNWKRLRRLPAFAVMFLFVADIPPGPRGGCRKAEAKVAVATPAGGIQG